MASARNVSFGALLRHLRTTAGLTQEALAAASGVGVRTISDLERGLAERPRAATLAQLVTALQLTPEAQAALEAAARQLRQAGTLSGMPLAQILSETQESRNPLTPPLAGRAAELATIERWLAEQQAPSLFVSGEPGIGKSRLLAEAAVRAQAQGWMVLAGGCTRRSGQEPYAPLLSAFSRCLAALPNAALRVHLDGCAWLVRLLPELAERALAPVPAWTLSPEHERRLMYAAAGRFLANVAGPAGTLLVLDDLQWAGEDALNLLDNLIRAANDLPLRMLAAYRDTEVPSAHRLAALLADLAREGRAEQMALGPLVSAEVRELLSSLLDRVSEPDREHLRERLLARGEGIPFFLVSCARAAAQDTGEGKDAELPWTVQQSIRQRVVALPETARTLLGLAAVQGREMRRRPLLAAAQNALGADQAALLMAVEATYQAGLLMEDSRGGYVFAHDLIREVILADLGATRRVAWHLAWAEALEELPESERPEGAVVLAWHFAQADEPGRALPYMLAAGDRAEVAYARVEAERHYRTAVDLARAVGDRSREAEALEKLGTIFETQGRSDEAVHCFEQAVSQRRAADDREGLAWATGWLARACDRSGRQDRGIEHLRNTLVWLTPDEPLPPGGAPLDLAGPRAERALTMLSTRLAARFGLSLGNYLWRLERSADAHMILIQAVARAHDSGDQKVEATARLIWAHALFDLGRVREAETTLEDAARLAESAGDLDILSAALIDLAVLQLYRADLTPASGNGARGAQMAEQLRDPRYTESGAVVLSNIAFLQGAWPLARAHLERASDILRQTAPHFTPNALFAASHRLEMLQGGGDPATAALERLTRVEATAAPATINHRQLALAALAESELLAGRVDAAFPRLEPHLGAGDAAALSTPALITSGLVPLLAWASTERGDVQRADGLLRAITARARQLGYRPALADALRVEALLATARQRWSEAETSLEESLALCWAMPYPYAEAKAQYVFGLLEVARAAPVRARKHFGQALATLGRLGERLYAAHVARALEELDV